MIQRPLWTIPISNALICKLEDAGFNYVEDLCCDARKEELRELIGSKLNISELTETAHSKTALDVYKDEIKKNRNIVTFSKSIDGLFDGGIPTGRITEIVGAPGTGKTQICLQLCVSVQIPEFLGGISCLAAYIETNSNFSLNRIKEIHDSCSRHCIRCSSKENKTTLQENEALKKFANVNSVSSIIKFSVETVEELRASIFSVENLLEKSNKKIGVLIIDSFTFPFYSVEADLKRTKIISEMMKQLSRIASTHHIAVIVTNELTTCIFDNGVKEIIPSLGETFAHAVHNRILVGRDNSEGRYTALVCKSSEFPSRSVYFQITDGGIRDVPSN